MRFVRIGTLHLSDVFVQLKRKMEPLEMEETEAGFFHGRLDAFGGQAFVKGDVVEAVGGILCKPAVEVPGVHPEIPGKDGRRIAEGHQFHELSGQPEPGGGLRLSDDEIANGVCPGQVHKLPVSVETCVITAGSKFVHQRGGGIRGLQVIPVRPLLTVHVSGEDLGDRVLGSGGSADGVPVKGKVSEVPIHNVRVLLNEVLKEQAVDGIQHENDGIVTGGGDGGLAAVGQVPGFSSLPAQVLYQEDSEGNQLGGQEYAGGNLHDPTEFFPEAEHEEDEQADDGEPEQGVQHIPQGICGPVDQTAVQGAVVDYEQVALDPGQEGDCVDCCAEGNGQLLRKQPGEQGDEQERCQGQDSQPAGQISQGEPELFCGRQVQIHRRKDKKRERQGEPREDMVERQAMAFEKGSQNGAPFLNSSERYVMTGKIILQR